ncbi:hypothetical protein [Steroidobacter sp.]|uniref:hypothetical protein n=1 Tax=Steroidobacter sp. TaxID=1978227 RepID=UPI001A4072A1|nr:hypothetical protein [Steroidobacter sp.]MBL8266249.1 hypothetical protein [Steroidobacter sp.]
MISAPLAAALESRRSDFNARFRLAAQRYPQLDGQELLRFIADAVSPLAQAVHASHPDAVADVVSVAYDCALQLVGQRLSLDAGRYAAIPETWREVFPAAAAVIAGQPARVIPALTNAAHQLASTDAADASRWIRSLQGLAAQCATPDELLMLGQVVAWQCGLAHYREGVLSALGSLPAALASTALGVESRNHESTLRHLQDDRWFDPAQSSAEAFRVVRSAGAFRGFGGPFLQPPLLKSSDEGWLVRSGDDYWFLVADAFGATLHRSTAEEWNAQPERKANHVGTRLVHEGKALDMPGSGPITSSGLSAGAIGCTFAHSHRILLVAVK